MKRLLSIVLVLILSLTLFTACNEEDKVAQEIYVPIRTGNSINYETVVAYRGSITEREVLTAEITYPYSTNLAFTLTGGTIAHIDLRPDMSVKEGDVLCRLSDEALEEEIVIQKLKLDSAKNTYEILIEKKASEEEIAFAKIEYDVEQLEYDALIEKREHLVLKAPFDGIITYVGNVWNGASVRQNQTICTIADASRPRLAANDYRGVLKNIEFGTKVEVNQGALANTTGKVVDFRTTSTRWGFGDDPITVNQYVIQCDEEVEFSDMGGIEVTFTTLRRDEAIIVPTDAVFETDEGHYVNVLMNGVKVQITVTVGVVSGDRTEILTGLEGGEVIII
ncbi:MAG: hypothetical protein IJ424_05325 [Oscillospiraceae bacterium]|nr:hypothetical protein [Oscillospiraceae bacterium]